MFPVIDPNDMLLGVVTMADLARLAEDGNDAADRRCAADVASPIETVTLSDTLLEAIRRMGIRGTPALPVGQARQPPAARHSRPAAISWRRTSGH